MRGRAELDGESCRGWDHQVGVYIGPMNLHHDVKWAAERYYGRKRASSFSGVQTVTCITLTEVVIAES